MEAQDLMEAAAMEQIESAFGKPEVEEVEEGGFGKSKLKVRPKEGKHVQGKVGRKFGKTSAITYQYSCCAGGKWSGWSAPVRTEEEAKQAAIAELEAEGLGEGVWITIRKTVHREEVFSVRPKLELVPSGK